MMGFDFSDGVSMLVIILIVAFVLIHMYGLTIATMISTLVTNIILLYIYFSGVLSSPSTKMMMEKAAEKKKSSYVDGGDSLDYDNSFVEHMDNDTRQTTVDDSSALMAGARSCVDKIIERGSSFDLKKAAMQYGPELIASEAQHWWGNNSD